MACSHTLRRTRRSRESGRKQPRHVPPPIVGTPVVLQRRMQRVLEEGAVDGVEGLVEGERNALKLRRGGPQRGVR